MGSILEMLIVLVGAALLTVQGIKEDIAAKHTNLLQIEGQNLASINAALGSYVTAQYGSLIPAGYSQTVATPITPPSLLQLSALANNRVTFKNGPFWGGTYQIAMMIVPDACSTAAGTCHIATSLYPSLPLMKAGSADIEGAGIIASAGGSSFGYSTNRAPSVITGIQGKWTLANPNGNKSGTILAINGFGADGNSPYYRRDGTLPLTGTMNANNQDMQNIGNMSGKTLALQAGNSLNIGGGATYYGDGTNAAVRTNGALFVQNQAGTAAANVNMGALNATTATLSANGGALTIGTAGVNFYGDQNGSAAIRGNNGLYVQDLAGNPAPIQQVASINSTGTVTAPVVNFNVAAGNCAWNTVTMRGANQMWVCNKYGNWVPLSNLIGNFTTDAQLQGYYNGWQIAVPACGPGGSAWWKVIPSSVSTNYATANPPLAGVRYGMGYTGVNWVLQIYDVLADGNNSLVQDQLSLQAEVDTGCSFGNE
ncbi:hypothetical protein LJR034_008593 [Caballeronia sp. LjRoot34]|uniref:hypothetical protein n=1 Tax=Caballeronia sp. LjRoot34 TaxID=3342325 RepID=UPI003ECC4736